MSAEDAQLAKAIGETLSALIRAAIRVWFIVLIWQRFGSYYGWLATAGILMISGFAGATLASVKYYKKAGWK